PCCSQASGPKRSGSSCLPAGRWSPCNTGPLTCEKYVLRAHPRVAAVARSIQINRRPGYGGIEHGCAHPRYCVGNTEQTKRFPALALNHHVGAHRARPMLRSAEQCDEITALHHSITSSAPARITRRWMLRANLHQRVIFAINACFSRMGECYENAYTRDGCRHRPHFSSRGTAIDSHPDGQHQRRLLSPWQCYFGDLS